MKLKFDRSHNVIIPAFVLTARNGRQIGAIPAENIVFRDRLNAYKELSFTVYKYDNGVRNDIWYKIDNLRLCYCPEWNLYFQMSVEINENDYTRKDVSCISLGEAELSQIMIFTTEINTENDILRDDYMPTVLWNANNPQASLLSRITEKAPHYKIRHVDESIKRIQRTFTFDNISIYDAFQEIATEIKCIFIIETKRTNNKAIERSISVYDLENICDDCGYRGEFTGTCPKCEGENITNGYGQDTTIFCSADNLAEDIRYSVNLDNVKNCFKLEAGDELMTATVINCNANGTPYIYYFNPQTREDMSKELSTALDEYTAKSQYYQSQYKFNISEDIISQYNALADKYVFYNDELKLINSEIKGFASLMDAFYATINFDLYLTDSMMPTMDLSETTAKDEAKKLNSMNLENVAVANKETATETTVTSAALSYARVLVDNRYKIAVKESSYSNERWTGSFTITRYSDETDTADTNSITVVLSDDYGTFVKQKIDKMLAKTEDSTAGIVALFKLADSKFKSELKKYCLASLTAFYESCQACINILIEQGVGDPSLWTNKKPNLYENMYLPYYNKLRIIQEEIKVREDEIAIIEGKYDKDGNLVTAGMQTALIEERSKANTALDFKATLGDELWVEFCSYRRESSYKNDNYISDGLNDTELFKRALEFLENAQKEIYKSSMLQHSISANLKNLLVMKEFATLVDYFQVGNWLRIRVDDSIYKLRLTEYEVDFDNIEHINVDFSDAIDVKDGISDLDSILKQAMSISSSYGTVAHQAQAGEQTTNQVKDWVDKGLNVTNQRIISDADNQNQVWDEHGLLLRKYDEVSEGYEDEQLKALNSTIAMTDDNWKTTKTAIGKYYYFDPEDEWKLKVAYGVIGETIVGKVILGEHLGIYSDDNSMTFDKNGLNITNGINNFNVNPNSNTFITLSNEEKDLLRVDEKGQLYLCGDGSALDINANDSILDLHSRITQTAGEIKMEVAGYQDVYDTAGYDPTLFGEGTPNVTGCPADENDGLYYLDRKSGGIWRSDGENWIFIYQCEMMPTGVNSYFDITKNKIKTYVGEETEGIYSRIEQTEGKIKTEVENAAAGLSSAIEQNAQSISAEVKRATEKEGNLESKISVNANGITSLVLKENQQDTAISSISQKVDRITSSVVTTDNTGNFIGTQIEQTPEWVRIAWNKYTDAVQFQNGGLYILDETGKALAILDRNGIVAEKGIFRGKVQSGDLSKYGVEISDGVLKGYRNNEVVAYVDTNNDVEIDSVVSPGMRIASKGGIVLRSPYLCVAKDYLDPDVHGEMLLGGNGSFNAVTSFETTGEGEDRKLVFNYKNLSFTNGIMTSNLQGGSNIVDYPEQPNPPQTDNTYQEEIEKAYADVVNDLSAENMGELSKRFFSSSIYGPTPKGEYGISGWNTDYKSGRMIIAPLINGVGTVRTIADNINWLPNYGFDCNPYIEGVPNSERWYGRKLLKDCGLTRNFMWPLLNTMVSNFGYVNSNMYISFFVVGYAGDSWYVSDIMRGDDSAMLANTTNGQWDFIVNEETQLCSKLWWQGSPPHHACANAGCLREGFSTVTSILPSWFDPSDLKNYWPSVFSTINSFLIDKGLPGASDSYIAKSIMGWSASYNGASDISMDNLYNAPIGVQIFNINGVPHYTLGTAWKNGDYIYYYDNVVSTDHNTNANSTITNAHPLVLPITKLSAKLSHARIYATYDCATLAYFHEGLKRLKLMRSEFLALK